MEHFASGRHQAGMKSMHDFFDNNIFMYFDQDRATNQTVADQKKEEYKMAVEHSSLQQVSIAMKNFLFEASSKLLEETLRWAQLNHHETQVQYSLLQKGQMMHKLGDSKMHFTFVEDALVKALAFNNYSLQIQACMQLIATDAVYDLTNLRKETGQYKNLNSSLIINNAFVKLLIDACVRPSGPSLKELALLRTTMLNQRRDYLCGLGFRKRNLLLKKQKKQPLAVLDKESCGAVPVPEKVAITEYLHLEQLLDENCEVFYQAWEHLWPRTKVGGRLNIAAERQLQVSYDYEATFFQAYFQAKLLLRRRDFHSVGSYVFIMETVVQRFPEPLLVFKLWAFRNELMIEKGSYESAFTSTQFLLKNLEGSGYKKELYLLEKYKVALVLFRTGKHLRAFEELNAALTIAKESSLNDAYVKCKLLQAEINWSLGFSSKCISTLQKLGSSVMMSSALNKLRFRELEIKACLTIAKERGEQEGRALFNRVAQHVTEAINLAANLDQVQSLKQLLFVSANVHNLLEDGDRRDDASTKVLRVVSAERFLKEEAPQLLSLDDYELNTAVNRQLSQMLQQIVSSE